MSIPPGKTLFVVISRSLCECHMNAQPRSFEGLACVFAGFNVVQFAYGAVEVPGVPVPPLPFVLPVAGAQVGMAARRLASGPKYGVPPYHWPLVNTFGSGKVAGPPPPTSPKGFTCIGLLWSWHHS